jgi:hypothetical protein
MRKRTIFGAAWFGLFAGMIHGVNTRAAETNVFPWLERPRLTVQQQRLLQLEKSIGSLPEGSPLKVKEQEEAAKLRMELGERSVRAAKPYELRLSRTEATNVCRIHNPTMEGLVISISVVGDTQRMGTRQASMARETYIPAGNSVIVSNLYWTSPATKTEK